MEPRAGTNSLKRHRRLMFALGSLACAIVAAGLLIHLYRSYTVSSHVASWIALRLDERAGRLFVQPAGEDRYFASGWELRSEADFVSALAELAARGVAFTRATSAERALRHVTDMAWILDPSGNRHELSYGYVTDFARFC